MDAQTAIHNAVLSGVWARRGFSREDAWPATWGDLIRAPPGATIVAPPLALVLASLRHALESGDYSAVPGLDAATNDLLRRAGMTPNTDLLTQLRPVTAKDWSVVLEGFERERLKSAHAAAALALASPSARVELSTAAQHGYVPQLGDKTVSDLVAVYKQERASRPGAEQSAHRYVHIYKALEQVLGPTTPLKSISRADCRKLRDLLKQLPKNASRRWPGRSLQEWIDLSAGMKTPLPRLAPDSVSSYVTALIGMLNFALKEEWIDRNPASGLKERRRPQVKRRAFTPDELRLVFAHPDLQDIERRWFCRLLLYTGMRAGEIIQLRPTDVKKSGKVIYLDLSEFDRLTGKRDEAKSLKTDRSERVIPLHRDLGGSLDWAQGRNSERLFTSWTAPGPRGNWSHYVSRWFAKVLDDVGLQGSDTVMYSFRHGWSNAAERANLLPRLRNSLGGWALQDQGDKYGAAALGILSRAMNKIEFEGFRP